MKFFCDQCNAQYMIADEKVGPKGVKVKCKKCANVILVRPLAGDSTRTVSSAASTPKPGGEITGAFDSLFTGDDKVAASTASSSEKKPTLERDWYVAIDESQVGPIDMAELQQRWDAGEINEDSLAWKTGMPDWVPISDIPDLTALMKRKPTAGSSTAAGQAAVKSASAIDWKPSAASALSSLVQEELVAANAPKQEKSAAPPDGVPDLGMPKFGANDLFGGNVSSPAPPTSDGFGGSGGAWVSPSARRSDTGSKPVIAIAGVMGIAVLGILALLTYFIVFKSSPPAVVVAPAPAPAAAAAPVAAAPAAPAATAPAAPAASAAAEAAKVAAAKDDEDDEHSPHHKGKHKAVAHAGGAAATPPPPAPMPSGPVKAALGRDDIFGVVRANAVKTAPCLQAARKRNEIAAGSYKFTLDWNISPAGAVSGAQLKGPPEVLGSSLPACFAAVMNQWRFPASQGGAPIHNFPFGPINVP